jgi:hypothetical protein
VMRVSLSVFLYFLSRKLLMKTGFINLFLLMALSGDFVTWAISPEARFLTGRFVWANWDVDEVKDTAPQLAKDPEMFTMGLRGM